MFGHQYLELFLEETLGIFEKLFRGCEPVLREATDVGFIDRIRTMVGKLSGDSAAEKLACARQQTVGLTPVPYPELHPCTRNSSDSSGLSVPTPLQRPPAAFRLPATRSQVVREMVQSVLQSALPASRRP
jgi:hypothetical protein